MQQSDPGLHLYVMPKSAEYMNHPTQYMQISFGLLHS